LVASHAVAASQFVTINHTLHVDDFACFQAGLTANFAVECALLRYYNPAEEAAAISAGIRLTRAAFALFSAVVLLVSFLTYR
jgi:hypothetical protein